MESIKSLELNAARPDFDGAKVLPAALVCPHCNANIPCGSPSHEAVDKDALKSTAKTKRILSATSAARRAKITIFVGLALWTILSHVTITVDKFFSW